MTNVLIKVLPCAQDMLRDEFGIGQLGKRLKILDAAKAAAKSLPKAAPKKKKAPAPAPAPSKAVVAKKGERRTRTCDALTTRLSLLSVVDGCSQQRK